jgi:lipopolysaccharide transport system permease protein
MENTRIFIKRLATRIARLFSKANRNLLKELVRAQIKLTDHNSVLGFLWSLINPVAMLLVMYFIFRERFGRGITAYPLYLLIGISSVNFFVTATTYAIRIFSVNRDVILNSNAPRELIVASHLFMLTYKFIIELAFCLILSFFYGMFSLVNVVLLLPLVLGYVALITSVGFLLATIYCFNRDIEHIWMLLSRLLFFITPVFYTLNNTSLFFRKIIYWANPLTPFTVSFHELIMDRGHIQVANYLYALILGGLFLIAGYSLFFAIENTALEKA